MKAIVCELCGSNEIIKQDGFFTCQSCGTKYDLEEARKLMNVSVVKVDRSSEVDNRLKNAVNEYKAGNTEVAYQLFVEILNIDSDNPEAIIFKALSSGWSSSVGNNKLISTASEIERALDIIRKQKDSDKEYTSSCQDALEEMHSLAFALYKSYLEYNKKMLEITNGYMKIQNGANISAADHAVSGVVGGLLTGNVLLAAQSVVGGVQISNSGNMSEEIRNHEIERANTYNNGCHFTSKALIMIALHILKDINKPQEVENDFYELLTNFIDQTKDFLITKEDVDDYNRIISKIKILKNASLDIEKKRQQEELEKQKALYWEEHLDEKNQLEKEKEDIINRITELKEINRISQDKKDELLRKKDEKLQIELECLKQAEYIRDLERNRNMCGVLQSGRKKQLTLALEDERAKYEEMKERSREERSKFNSEIKTQIDELSSETELRELNKRLVQIKRKLENPEEKSDTINANNEKMIYCKSCGKDVPYNPYGCVFCHNKFN